MNKIKKLSRYRILANNALRMSDKSCYPIHTNMEVNVSNLFKYKNRTGLNVNTVLLKSIADVIKENPRFKVMNSVMQKWPYSNYLAILDRVSFSVAMNMQYEGEGVAAVYILEDVDTRNIEEIDNEIKKLKDMTLKDLPIYKQLKFLLYLPSWAQRLLMFVSSLIPRKKAITYGGIGFTNLGKGPFESVFPVSPKTIIFGIGSSKNKVIQTSDGEFQTHPFMKINMTMNHFVVDGKICSDFLAEIKNKLESLV